MSEYAVRRGDIFYINKFVGQSGSEQNSGRPGVIISNDKNNEFCQTVEIVYCTTKPKEGLPTHCTIRSTSVTSTVLCEQVTTVDKAKLGDYIGVCTEDEMKRIETAVKISLALEEDYATYNPFKEHVEDAEKKKEVSKRETEMQRENIELKVQRDTYKALYDGLMSRLIPSFAAEVK